MKWNCARVNLNIKLKNPLNLGSNQVYQMICFHFACFSLIESMLSCIIFIVQIRGGQLISSLDHSVHLCMSRGPYFSQKVKLQAKKMPLVGRMLPASGLD